MPTFFDLLSCQSVWTQSSPPWSSSTSDSCGSLNIEDIDKRQLRRRRRVCAYLTTWGGIQAPKKSTHRKIPGNRMEFKHQRVIAPKDGSKGLKGFGDFWRSLIKSWAFKVVGIVAGLDTEINFSWSLICDLKFPRNISNTVSYICC